MSGTIRVVDFTGPKVSRITTPLDLKLQQQTCSSSIRHFLSTRTNAFYSASGVGILQVQMDCRPSKIPTGCRACGVTYNLSTGMKELDHDTGYNILKEMKAHAVPVVFAR